MSAVDPLTGAYSMPCPAHGTARVRLSSFRVLDRLPGASHPALYRIVFACACGDEHLALVSHDALDWSPLGLDTGRTFVNLMTARRDDLAGELVQIATERIGRGDWPWSFYCYLEERPRPVTPSSFRLVAAGERKVGVAISCPVCGSVSINIVSHAHVDLPFAHDPAVGVVRHVFEEDALRTLEEFRSELASSAFDERRLSL
jgi:hypothetical protein